MIYIEEIIPIKVVGTSSLKITFEYNADVVEILRSFDGALFHKKLCFWELPIIHLAQLVDKLTYLDSIDLKLLDSKENSSKIYKLSNYKLPPLEHQIDGIQYGLNHNKWLLLDACGLGKTATVIHIVEELVKANKVHQCLVICGVNTLKTNWLMEIKKHSDLSCRILGSRIGKRGGLIIGSLADRLEDIKSKIQETVVITNIETLRSDEIINELKKNKPNKFDMIVVDELHKAKSVTSAQGKHLLQLTADYQIGLTGTPLMNSPIDTFLPLKWLGVEHSTKTYFNEFYCNYVGKFHNILAGYKHLEVLKEQLDSISLRRTKDILNLPPKTIIEEYLDMDSKQSDFYQCVKDGLVEEIDKVKINKASLLGMVTRLRQATACPSILTSENIPSVKIQRAVDLVEEIVADGEKVIVFSTFKEPIYHLEALLSKYNPLVCTGDKKDIEIENNKNTFQKDNSRKVLLATFAKMSTGVTLTASRYIICIDCCWTAADNDQAESRIERIGAKNKLSIYYLMAKNTIDEHVWDIVNNKSVIGDFVVDNKITDIERLKRLIIDM